MARSKGEGGITRLEDKPKANCRLWRLKAVDWGGKTRYRRFHGTYSQAEAAMRRFKAELASPMSDETFGAYSQRWLDRRRRGGEISGQTRRRDLGADALGERGRAEAPADGVR